MDKNLDIIISAVALIIKAVIMAGRFSGTVRKRSLKRLAAMDTDTRQRNHLPQRQALSTANSGLHPSETC